MGTYYVKPQAHRAHVVAQPSKASASYIVATVRVLAPLFLIQLPVSGKTPDSGSSIWAAAIHVGALNTVPWFWASQSKMLDFEGTEQ